MAGCIYVLSNPAFKQHLYKVGRTDDEATKSHRRGRPRKRPRKNTGHEVQDRANQLSDPTGVPDSYVTEFYVEQEVSENFERSVHADLAHGRYNKNREFFELRIEEILEVIQRKLEEPITPFRVRIKTGTALTQSSRMKDIWKVKRCQFWKEIEHLQRVNCYCSQSSAEPNHFLAPNTEIENRIREFTAVVEEHACHVFPHPLFKDWAHLNLFSPNGICFAFIRIFVPKTSETARPYYHREYCYYYEDPLKSLARMCAALCKCEEEIHQYALEASVGRNSQTQ